MLDDGKFKCPFCFTVFDNGKVLESGIEQNHYEMDYGTKLFTHPYSGMTMISPMQDKSGQVE